MTCPEMASHRHDEMDEQHGDDLPGNGKPSDADGRVQANGKAVAIAGCGIAFRLDPVLLQHRAFHPARFYRGFALLVACAVAGSSGQKCLG